MKKNNIYGAKQLTKEQMKKIGGGLEVGNCTISCIMYEGVSSGEVNVNSCGNSEADIAVDGFICDLFGLNNDSGTFCTC